MAKKNEIAKVDTTTIQPVEQIESLILTIRGKQVILDQDLARLYGVETKRLNEQVKRNIERFPEDFMFQLSKEEAESSRSQFATLNEEDELLMEYALAGIDNNLFAARYQLYLPNKDELQKQLNHMLKN